MKTSKIIAIIAAVAIGLIIAVLLKQPDINTPKTTQSSTIQETKVTELTPHTKTKEPIEADDNKTPIEPVLSIEKDPINVNEDSSIDTEMSPTTLENTIPMITLKTSMGDINIALNADKAPLTVANFLKYAENGHYNGTIFHRVIPGFMIQGGGFEQGMSQKKVGMPVVNEANNGLKNDKYTIAMARTSDPHSATAQFFINAKDNDFLNFTSESGNGWGYAVFGEVINGKEVVDEIEKVATSRSGSHGDVPVENITIESVVVTQ